MNRPNLTTLITDATIVLPHGLTRKGCVIIEGSKIRDIVDTPPGSLLLSQDNVQVISGKGCYLTPGLIDLQMNGAFGTDFNRCGIHDIHQVLQKLPTHGVTGVLLTVVSAPHGDMLQTVNTLEEAIHHRTLRQTRILGIHLEGPFLNPKYRGAHPSQGIQRASVEEAQLLLSPHTRLMTLAPEMPGTDEIIAMLVERQIRVSAGHSNADVSAMLTAMNLGLNSVTHLYNAMRPFHHREPGIVGMGLADMHLYAQIIADGLHVHPYALEAAVRAKPPGKLILVSDAMALAGMPDGSRLRFAGQDVFLQQGRAINEEGHLAGSAALLNQCVKNIITWDLASFEDAVQMASANPAEYIGENHQLGRIQNGYLADLVLWDEHTLEPTATWIHGDLVYQRQASSVPY